MNTTELLVHQTQLATTRLREQRQAALADGQVRLQIEHFALTANNITYAVFGQAMQYWQFFPITSDDGQPWGCIPVWGFATVVQSLHSGVAVGERLYGYWPMASHAVLQPGRLSPEGFSDMAEHRAELHAVYNRYLRCGTDAFYGAHTEAEQALLRPLFLTAWLIDDFLADNRYFGAQQAASVAGQPLRVMLSSASSKTAYSTAALLAQREGVEVVGLTSAANMDFCKGLGCYHRVLAYDQLDQLPADMACVYVDMAGNAGLRLAVHQRFTALAYSCSVGGTHVEQLGSARELPGPKATLFFAPAQVKKRSADWGPDGLGQRLVVAWQAFLPQATDPVRPWLVVQRHEGPAAVQAAYARVLAGGGDPRQGHMLTLHGRA